MEQSDHMARFHLSNGQYLVDRGEYLEANAEFAAARDLAESRAVRAEAVSWLAQMAASFLDNPEQAYRQYQEIAEKYRDTEFYSGALFQLGMLSYQREELKEAREWFVRFEKEFPQSEQAATATFMLEKIRTLESKHELPPKAAHAPLGKIVRVRLGQAEEVEISAVRVFQAASMGYTFRTVTHFLAINGQVGVNSSQLGPGAIELTSAEPFHFKGRKYRGSLILTVHNKQVVVVNRLPLEEYLYSVVGGEMSAKWPAEALKAQAVASRTYAAYHIAHPPSTDYDLVDDTHSQEYEGIGRESASTRSAVDATAGVALGWQGQPILAAFTANNGGRSADSQAIFQVSYPYFAVKDDPYSKLEPFGHWERQYTGTEIRNALGDFGVVVGPVTDVRVAETDGSGRAVTVDVVSGNSAIRIPARSQFRVALNRYAHQRNMPENIPETLFTIQKTGDLYSIAGGGWGHGVGMSQEGAKARARDGQDYLAILAEYYPRTEKLQLY
jgi:stage II sporulation protein D